MRNLKIKGHVSSRVGEKRERLTWEDHDRKRRAHSKVSNSTAVIRCRTRYPELAVVAEKDSCGVCTEQGQSGKFNETANRFGHGAAGQGQKQSEVRRKLVPENETGRSTRGGSRRKRSGKRMEKRTELSISTVEGTGIPKIERDREEKC